MGLKRFLISGLIPLIGAAFLVGFAEYAATSAPPGWRWAAAPAASVAAAGLLLLIVYQLQRRLWLRPVRHLEDVAARMTNGDWSERAQLEGTEAVRGMAGHLNLLAAQVQKQLTDLQQQRGGLRALMDTMPDPILAADAQGRIVLLNAPAAQLLSVTPSEVLNQKLVNVVNDEEIVRLYEALIAGSGGAAVANAVQREIRLARNGQRSTYQAVARRMASGSSLLVLRDVSALAGAMQMKTDFVANASHELRTPIAAIKVAFETLRDVYHDDQAQTDRCINVIDGQLRRLEEMLRDLMDLSRVESQENRPRVAVVKTSDLLATVKSALGPQARERNVELRVGDDDPASPREFFTDTRLFHLVVKNLVENSIKFTPGGGKVVVSIRQTSPDLVTVTVADTGIGIAREHIDRVFERFYQVDAARSGSAGRGSGLGLAIVKHAVHALDGSVKLESAVGVGTTITCQFPQPEAAEAPEKRVAPAMEE
ncbi:MAG: ATP-binding protein [Tepidisphaeraceae bacterium]|jgi:two-component system phosphate regulon sensor histidine kinase PhoR